MTSLRHLLPLIIQQHLGPQVLQRTPEPHAVMDASIAVEQFDLAMESKLVIAYAGLLELIFRSRRTCGGTALDLACGPGHCTLLLAKFFDFERVIGIDLSEPMIERARTNAARWGLQDRVHFEVGDATRLPYLSESFSVVTCNDAAHHLPDLETVRQLVSEMDRVTAENGIVAVMDLVRLRTKSLTDQYVRVLGQDYLERGLDRFYQDFHDSMFAAWTPEEMQRTVPPDTTRRWQMIVQKLLPTIQILVGVPNDGKPLRIRTGFPWSENDCPIPKSMRRDWEMFRRLLR